MELVRADVAGDARLVAQHDLAHQNASVVVGIGKPAPAAVQRMHLRLVDRVPPVEALRRAGTRRACADALVTELTVLEEAVRDVDAEPIDAAVEPEAEDADEIALHLRVVPVEIRLFRREEMQVVLAARLVQRPSRAAEGGLPIVRRAAVASRPEDVTGLVRVGHESVEIGERAELRVDVDVVGHVVSVVGAGGRGRSRPRCP